MAMTAAQFLIVAMGVTAVEEISIRIFIGDLQVNMKNNNQPLAIINNTTILFMRIFETAFVGKQERFFVIILTEMLRFNML